MPLSRSLLADQLWSEKDGYAVTQWINDHGDPIARARGQVVIALDAYAREIKERKAHEWRQFSADEFIGNALDTIDKTLAPEVRAWLEG